MVTKQELLQATPQSQVQARDIQRQQEVLRQQQLAEQKVIQQQILAQQQEEQKWKDIVGLAQQIRAGKSYAGYDQPKEYMDIARQIAKGNVSMLPQQYQGGVKASITQARDYEAVTSNVVTIDGQSYSVAPSLQESFIQKKIGSRVVSPQPNKLMQDIIATQQSKYIPTTMDKLKQKYVSANKKLAQFISPYIPTWEQKVAGEKAVYRTVVPKEIQAVVSEYFKEKKPFSGITVSIPKSEVEFMGLNNNLAVQNYFRGKFPKQETIYGGQFSQAENQDVEEYLKFISPKNTFLPSKELRRKAIKETIRIPRLFEEGAYTTLRSKPLKFIGYTAAGVVLTAAVLPAVGSGVGYVIGASATKTLGGMAGLGLGIVYGAKTIKTIKETPFGERAKKLGGMFSTEVAPMVIGGAIGSYIAPRLSGYIRTFGRTEKIPIERLVAKSVLKGKEQFYSADKSKHKSLFLKESKKVLGTKEPVVIHATGKQWWKPKEEFVVMQPGKSELPGLYGSSRLSIHFLRIVARFFCPFWMS